NRPSRARKFFQGDLDRWKLQNTTTEKSLIAEQDAWVAQQHHDDFTRLEATAAAATASPRESLAYAQADYAPAGYAQSDYAPTDHAIDYPAQDPASPLIETQRLLDDVQALDVRPVDPRTESVSTN
ncbi:MAG TPA: hypothetical protein VFC59_02275, partial [Cryobacterium sp.]|nr:hypothetical protein [Cryobacterium sp.]